MKNDEKKRVRETLKLLDKHYDAFYSIAGVAKKTGHPVPTDTRGWSQILVSVLTGIDGIQRKKGADLEDGSDVKGANAWEAIDTPRFNGVVKAGTQAAHSGKLAFLDGTPNLFFVLWDVRAEDQHRCRIWVVRPPVDAEFRQMCSDWYSARAKGEIKSSNFQLHPPRGEDHDTIRNSFGNLSYPLLFSAVHAGGRYSLQVHDPSAATGGLCQRVD